MNKPLVTIIMPVYNRAQLVVASLQSAFDQSYIHWECIIVNDGSTDNSETVILDYIKNKAQFIYYKIDNGGAAKARNYGIRKSKGHYILPLDSDDLIDSRYLEKAVDLFEGNKGLKIVYSQAHYIGVKNEPWELPPYSYKLFLIYNMIHNSSMYKRADFDVVGGYTEDSLFEDWDLWIKLLKTGGEVFQIPEVLFYCRIHENDSVTVILDKNTDMFKKNMDQLYKNHIDTYLNVIGNPIELERERRHFESIIKTSEYKRTIEMMNHPIFKFLRKFRNGLKSRFDGA